MSFGLLFSITQALGSVGLGGEEGLGSGADGSDYNLLYSCSSSSSRRLNVNGATWTGKR